MFAEIRRFINLLTLLIFGIVVVVTALPLGIAAGQRISHPNAWSELALARKPAAAAVVEEFQPTAPYYAAFYYAWHGSPVADSGWAYWDGEGNNVPDTWFSHFLPDPLPAEFDPSRELYSSAMSTCSTGNSPKWPRPRLKWPLVPGGS